MLSDALEELREAVLALGPGALVNKHSGRLQREGELSVPAGRAGRARAPPDALLAASRAWRLPLCVVAEESERTVLRLQRPRAAAVALLQCRANADAVERALREAAVEVSADVAGALEDDLTSLRVRTTCEAVQRLAAVRAAGSGRAAPRLLVTAKSSTAAPTGTRLILCGAVLNLKTSSKETTLKASEYVRMRQCEMTLIAQHKYGVRVSLDDRWKEFLSQLGESAVVYELLQIKPSSAIKINFDNPASGSSKGASFVLYNCARLETLVRTFKEKVDAGEYPPAPDIEDTDFTLLKDEDEWSLLFNYVLCFPSLLKTCFEVDDQRCHVAPHRLCIFLSSLVLTFSHYYRRVRILTEPRQHLLPVMYARLHLLVGLNTTLKMCLRILNIKAVTQM